MTASRRRAAVVICAWLSASCRLESGIRTQTQVVVDIDADRNVRDQVDHVQLTIAGSAMREQLAAAPVLVDRSLYVRMASGPHWPLREVLMPQGADATRVYALTVTAFDARDHVVVEARALSGYVRDEIRTLPLNLTTACLGVSCASDETCADGECAAAWRAPQDLARFTGSEDDIPWANRGAYTDRRQGGADLGLDAGASERDLDAGASVSRGGSRL